MANGGGEPGYNARAANDMFSLHSVQTETLVNGAVYNNLSAVANRLFQSSLRQYPKFHYQRAYSLPNNRSCRFETINARLMRPGAKKINFLRNGYRFFQGFTMPVLELFHKNIDILLQQLTKVMEKYTVLHGPLYTIYSATGEKVLEIGDLISGDSYYCATKREPFMPFEVQSSAKTRAPSVHKLKTQNCIQARHRSMIARIPTTPSSRIINLICNGVKPRRICLFLLNDRTAHDFDQVLSAISMKVKLQTGAVRKIYTLSGRHCENLKDLYEYESIFLVYGQERPNYKTDAILHDEEKQKLNKYLKKSYNLQLCNSGLLSKKSSLSTAFCTTAEWPTTLRAQYNVCELVGTGEYSAIFKVNHTATNKFYALKLVHTSSHKSRQFAENEKSIHQLIRHDYILRLIKSFEHQKYIFLLTEYMEHGDLFNAMEVAPSHKLDVAQAKIVIKQLGEALVYLHERAIVHRDVKPENILVKIDDDGIIRKTKLADFGLACVVHNKLYAVCGSVLYIAPEILLGTGYGRKVDIWATGALMYMILHGHPPFDPETSSHNDIKLYEQIQDANYIVDQTIDEATGNLIKRLMEKCQRSRYTALQLVNDVWFQTS